MNPCHRAARAMSPSPALSVEYKCSQWEQCATCLVYLLKRAVARAEAAESALENTTRILEAAERLLLEEGVVFSREP